MKLERQPLFEVGDAFKVVNYGSIIWTKDSSTGKLKTIDINPDIVGKLGIVTKVTVTQGIPQYGCYSKEFSKRAWFNEGQMELVAKNSLSKVPQTN